MENSSVRLVLIGLSVLLLVVAGFFAVDAVGMLDDDYCLSRMPPPPAGANAEAVEFRSRVSLWPPGIACVYRWQGQTKLVGAEYSVVWSGIFFGSAYVAAIAAALVSGRRRSSAGETR